MGISQAADQFFTYESRLISFQKAQPISRRRASIVSIRDPKLIKWPHKFLSAQDLAKAGFFYFPTQINPDNVACFLCHSALDGWEESDNPLSEHLKHSPNCGWAITASTEKLNGNLREENPLSTRMIEARKATFGKKWPHENKRGWKCRTKQMAEGGWKYTPTMQNDDTVSCSYCALSINNWEKFDLPVEKHFEQSPDCAFFTSMNNRKDILPTKRVRTQTTRASKVSRLSVQSNLTVTSDVPSVADSPAMDEDSIMTADTISSKKVGADKKTVLGRNRKTRANKNEPIEITEPEESRDHAVYCQEYTRDRKRKSDEFQSIEKAIINAPSFKKRATRSRANTVVDDSIKTNVNLSTMLISKAKCRKTKSIPKNSMASPAPSRNSTLDGIELNLEEDIVSDDEGYENIKTTEVVNANHQMFGLKTIDIDEAVIEAELDMMEVNNTIQPKSKSPISARQGKFPNRHRATTKKAATTESQQTRKQISTQQNVSETVNKNSSHSPQRPRGRAPSRQVTKVLPHRQTRRSTMSSQSNDQSTVRTQSTDSSVDSGNDTDESLASQSTVVRNTKNCRGSIKNQKKKGHSRNIEEIVHVSEGSVASLSRKDPIRPAKGREVIHSKETSITEPKPKILAVEIAGKPAVDGYAKKQVQSKFAQTKNQVKRASASTSSLNQRMAQANLKENLDLRNSALTERDSFEKSLEPPIPSTLPSTNHTLTGHVRYSLSSQSSDIENQPPPKPCSTITNTATPQKARRVFITFSTPTPSPSRHIMNTVLQSDQPWTAVDLEAIFLRSPSSPSGVNGVDLLGSVVNRAKDGELTTPEKNMTVEEWIHYNARMAEEKLWNECERMVGNFEREGTRAMRALEGVECCK